MSRCLGLLGLALLLVDCASAPTATTAAPTATTSDPSGVEGELQQLLDGWVADAAPLPGAVLAVRFGHGSIWVGASGEDDTIEGRRMDPADTFRFGSITKTFIALAVLQLVEEETIDLDESPSVLDSRIDPSVTWRHLLAHQSGVIDYSHDGGVVIPIASGGPSLGELVDSSLNRRLQFTPGSTYSYSNTNYALLGELLEKATGLRTHEAIRARVLEPAGLAFTFLEGWEPGMAAAAPDGDPFSVDRDAPERAGAAGAMVSSGADLLAFLEATFVDGLLPPTLLDEATTSVDYSSGESAHYGLGIEVLEPDGAVAWGHTGGIEGFRSAAMWFPDDQVGMAVLMNALLREPDPLGLIEQVHVAVVG